MAVPAPSMKRVQKELREIESNTELREQMWIVMEDDSLKALRGFIRGPPDTPYAGGIFEVSIELPDTYPFVPPLVRFMTKVWHPNISSANGYICLDILSDAWAASLTLKAVLMSLQALLQQPQADDPQDAVVARQARRSKKRFQITARYWTFNYAMGEGTELPADLDEYEQKVIKMIESRGVDREKAVTILSSNNWHSDPVRKSTRATKRRGQQFIDDQ